MKRSEMKVCMACSHDKGREVRHRELRNCPYARGNYYAPMSSRRLTRYVWRRTVPWWLRWLFGWR